MSSTRSLQDLVAAARAGEARAVARLISLVEDRSPQVREVMALLAPHVSGAHVIGLTGTPGVGKSTTTSALVTAYRERDLRVGVLAIDPTSPFTGGALLGDRVRMQEHALDRGVFIRSMASRGRLGGLSWSTPHALRVLEVSGCEVIFIETVGVGQAEVDIAALADTTLVLLAPGMGDSIQAAKAGILEIADVFVVNKADRDGADLTVRQLRQALSMSPSSEDMWRPPVIKTAAVRQEGLSEIVRALLSHASWLADSGEGARRRLTRAAEEIRQIALASLNAELGDLHGDRGLDGLAARVADGLMDPYAAADELRAAIRGRK